MKKCVRDKNYRIKDGGCVTIGPQPAKNLDKFPILEMSALDQESEMTFIKYS